MDKYEYIVNLAEKTAKRVSQNRESWMKFLTSAARIYKYPFKEQLLIYAQNPDATACASIEIWNKRMNCWVNKGSSGIALPDDTATYGHKLKYVFDVSNVHAVKPNGRYPKAWKLREEHKSDVLHRLEQIYGSTDSTKPFEERIIEISDQLAADAYTELQIDYPDLQDRIGFDKLSEQDFALCLKKLISESVSFTILSACGIEISDHEFSFDYINQFVSIKTLSVLGTKINDSARGVLAEIGKTVCIYDKLREKEQEKEISKKELANAPQPRYNALKRESLQEGNSKGKDNIEGGKQNGPGIRTDGRLSDSETESKSGTGGNGNEIRTSEGQISEGEIRWGENSNVSGRNAESTSSRDSGTGKREDGSPDIPDGGERRSKRTAQSTGSDALGEEDEQHPEPGGGSRTERTDLQPTNFVKPEESYTQLSLFPSAEEQRGSITAAEASKKYTMPAAFYLSETDLEVIIRSGGGQKDSRKRIYAKYTEGKSTDEIIAFLKKEYSQVGKGFELHGHPISVWFDENGMTAGYGMQAAESVVTTLSWDQIEKYIHAMITYGLYMDANEAALVDKTEMERVSYQIGYFLRDWIDDVPEELNSITSKGTLDKSNPEVRKYLAQRAELLGAVRLPNKAFKSNAGTEVTSDILFLKKRDHMIVSDPDWVYLGKDESDITMNNYFVEHPEQIVGKMEMVSGPYGMESTCTADDSQPFEEQLQESLQNINGEFDAIDPEEILTEDLEELLSADPNVKNYSFTVVGKEIYYRENSVMRPVDVSATAKERIKGMIGIRDCTRALINLQLNEYSDADIKQKQEELSALYDGYTAKFGILNSRANRIAFDQDSSYSLICSLENLDEEGNFKEKAAIFQKRTIKQEKVVTSVDTASEALTVSLSEKAVVDLPYMSELSGKDTKEIVEELRGVIFEDPITGKWETADEYLSGNVREKLKIATSYAETKPEFSINVQALKQIQICVICSTAH